MQDPGESVTTWTGEELRYNLPPASPWGFRKFALAGHDIAQVISPHPDEPMTVPIGLELFIHADLFYPEGHDPYDPAPEVQFMFAPRIIHEMIDPAEVSPVEPFGSAALAELVLNEIPGDAVILEVREEGDDTWLAGTYHGDLSDIVDPTRFDFTIEILDGGGENMVVFGALPAPTDAIRISYDFGEWIEIGVDQSAPYTAAWTIEEGGVPHPADLGIAAATAYDLVAIARFEPVVCGYVEPIASEGNFIHLLDPGANLPPQVVHPVALQYRIGLDGEFEDHLVGGAPVEYMRSGTPGDVQAFGPLELPAELLEQEYLQLLWRYYHVEGTSGPRAELRLDEIRISGEDASSVGEPALPQVTLLRGNVPNPFGSGTVISFSVREGKTGRLEIFDAAGRRVRSFPGIPQGRHNLRWDATDESGRRCAGGVYFYRLSAGENAYTRKMLMLR